HTPLSSPYSKKSPELTIIEFNRSNGFKGGNLIENSVLKESARPAPWLHSGAKYRSHAERLIQRHQGDTSCAQSFQGSLKYCRNIGID
ncbi:MAG: hypothetical protein WCF09_04185, partial [Gallionella sp.]